MSALPETKKLKKELRGDLDNIILTALHKEPQRRYASVEALSEDIRRYLEGHPVQARNATWTYLAGKYVRRHKTGLAAAALIVMLLLASAITVFIQNVRIAKERDAAQQARTKAEAEEKKALQILDFMVKLFEVNDPFVNKGEVITAKEILERSAKRINTELKEQPEVQAELLNKVGAIYEKLGIYDQAISQHEQSLKIRRAHFGPNHLSVAESLNNLGTVFLDKGQYDEAEKRYREALAIGRAMQESGQLSAAESLQGIGGVVQSRGFFQEAEKFQREALAIRRKVLGNEHRLVAESLERLGEVVVPEQEQLFRQALDMLRKSGEISPDVAALMNNLGFVSFRKQKYDEAERYYREALAMNRKLLGNDHQFVVKHLCNLGSTLHEKGQLGEAEKIFREALTTVRKMPQDHPIVGSPLYGLAGVLVDRGQLDEAEEHYRESLAVRRKALGDQHWVVATDFYCLAEVMLYKGKHSRSTILSQYSTGNSFGKDACRQPSAGSAKSVLGAVFTTQRKFPEAETLLVEAQKVLLIQKGSRRYRINVKRIIDLYQAWGRPDKAEAYR